MVHLYTYKGYFLPSNTIFYTYQTCPSIFPTYVESINITFPVEHSIFSILFFGLKSF